MDDPSHVLWPMELSENIVISKKCATSLHGDNHYRNYFEIRNIYMFELLVKWISGPTWETGGVIWIIWNLAT